VSLISYRSLRVWQRNRDVFLKQWRSEAPGFVIEPFLVLLAMGVSLGSFVRMKVQKTYDAIIATPLNIEDVAAGFGLVHSPWAVLVVPLSVLSGIMFASIALFFTSLAPSIYSFNYYFTLFMTPMLFFSGVFFPLDSFPPLVQHLSWIAPLTPVANLARALMSGDLGTGAWWGLAIIAGLIAVFFPLSLYTMRRRLLV
jgi:lipooligosaccharide transport system permease protein